ncbi:hypothetical protein XANCAGTX0491_000688 [Xanthoria calcicola]
MAELALVINIIETVKLTYQVARYVHKTIQSAKNEDMEQQQISSDFKIELLFLGSFTRYFEKAQGAIAYDQALDELWLLEIEQVIGHLKRDFSEYEDYASKAGSKSFRGSTSSLPLLTKPTTSRSPSAPRVDANAEEESSSMSQKLKDGQSKIYRKAKWALFDRQNLRNIVERFQKRNKTLREILQFAMAGILQQVAKRGQGFNSLQQDQDAVALGLNTWAEIRQIKDQPERIDQDYSIGNLQKAQFGKNKIRKESVLVEYKTYPPAPEGISGANSQDLDQRIGKRVNQLASLLSTAGSNALGTLPFRGFLKEPDRLRYAFVFDMPGGTKETKPDSLHHMIESPDLGRLWSLSDRFNLAVDLSKTIGTFHMFEWVLKGFRSSSVVFCYDEQTAKPQLGRPYIAGFEYIRPVSGSTVGQPLDILQQARPPRPSKPGEIREEYIRKATSKLPLRMGQAYTEAVVACLESRHKYQAIKPDIFLNVFDREIVQKLSAKRLLR